MSSNLRVRFVPFVVLKEDGEVLLGRPDDGVFISLPEEAFDIVLALESGRTLGEVRQRYADEHGEIPDVEDLVQELASRGFVASGDSSGVDRAVAVPQAAGRRFHFTGISQKTARRLFSRPVLLSCAAVVLVALVALVLQPSLLPGWRSLYFESDMTPIALSIMALGLLTTFLHEMAHLLAARSKGVFCRLSVGNRLWVLVAETDMTGIWALPKKDRYLPLLAGPLFDVTVASSLFLVLFAERLGWFSLASRPRQFLAALVFGALLRLLWQCFFFVRTDFYYVFASLFGCKRLMEDTRAYLRHRAAKWIGRRAPEPLQIPEREMRAIRLYSVFWIVGRSLAFISLFVVTLPLAWSYTVRLGSNLLHASSLTRYQLVDSGLILAIQLTITLLGLAFWVWSLMRGKRRAS